MKMNSQDQNQNWRIYNFCFNVAGISSVLACLGCVLEPLRPGAFFVLCFTLPMLVVFPALRDLER